MSFLFNNCFYTFIIVISFFLILNLGYNGDLFRRKELFVDYYKDYPKKEDVDINAATIYKINDRRLSNLEKIEPEKGVDFQNRIDEIIYEMNKI